MRRRLLLVIALSLLAPSAAAGAIGEVESAAPLEFFGDVTTGGSQLFLYHSAFADGTLSGTIFSGRIIDRERHHDCSLQPSDQNNVLKVVTPDSLPLYFEVNATSIVVGEFGDEHAFATGTGPATDASKEGAVPVVRTGPNPYLLAAPDEDPPGSPSADLWVRAFPMGDFISVPSGDLGGPIDGTLVVEYGNLTTMQSSQKQVFSTQTTFENDSCVTGPLPFPPSSQPTKAVFHSLRLEITTGVLNVRQSHADRVVAFYKGEATPKAPPSDRGGMTPPQGYWDREDGAGAAKAYESYALPSTILTAPSLEMSVAGVARLNDARGKITDAGGGRDLDGDDLSLSGNLVLYPTDVIDGGRRQDTRVEGSLFSVDVGAPKPITDLTPYAAGAAGGAILLGLAVYAGPSLKWLAARWLLLPLYARLKKEEVLENPLRDDILQTVQDEPGISASELGRRMECGWGTLVYHLTVLERMQLVSSAREGRHKRFFAQGRINYSDKGAVGLLANPAANTILDAIRGAPGLMQKELSQRLSLSAGTVAWHVERLSAEGLVVKEEDGRSVRYYPSDRLLDLTRRLAA